MIFFRSLHCLSTLCNGHQLSIPFRINTESTFFSHFGFVYKAYHFLELSAVSILKQK